MTLCSVVHCEMLCASLAVGWTCKCNSFSFSPIFLQHSAMLVVLQLEQKTESESSIVAQNSNKCHGWKWLILHFSLTLSSLKRTPLSLSRHNCWLRFQKLWQRNPDIITLTLMTLVVMYWSVFPFKFYHLWQWSWPWQWIWSPSALPQISAATATLRKYTNVHYALKLSDLTLNT